MDTRKIKCKTRAASVQLTAARQHIHWCLCCSRSFGNVCATLELVFVASALPHWWWASCQYAMLAFFMVTPRRLSCAARTLRRLQTSVDVVSSHATHGPHSHSVVVEFKPFAAGDRASVIVAAQTGALALIAVTWTGENLLIADMQGVCGKM